VGHDRQGVPAAAPGPADAGHDDRDAGHPAGRARIRSQLRCEIDPRSSRRTAGCRGRSAAAQPVPGGRLAARGGPGVGAGSAARWQGRGRGNSCSRRPATAHRRQPAVHRAGSTDRPRQGRRPCECSRSRRDPSAGHDLVQPEAVDFGHHDPWPGRRGAGLHRHDPYQPRRGQGTRVRHARAAGSDAAAPARRFPRQDRALFRRGHRRPGNRPGRRHRDLRQSRSGARPRCSPLAPCCSCS